MCTCACVGVYIPLHTEGGQKTTCRNCFSSSCGPRRLNSGEPHFPENALPTELVGQSSRLKKKIQKYWS